MYLLIGYEDIDGSIEAIVSRQDGGVLENCVLYKYYRTPKRVRALIKNGSWLSNLGISISQDELNPDSPLYNEEASNLPIGIGSFWGFSDSEIYPMVGYHNTPKKVSTLKFPNEEAFFDAAAESDFSDQCIFIFNAETKEWTEGYDKIDLRTSIINDFHDECYEGFYEDIPQDVAEKTLLNDLDEIDRFIEQRDNNIVHKFKKN